MAHTSPLLCSEQPHCSARPPGAHSPRARCTTCTLPTQPPKPPTQGLLSNYPGPVTSLAAQFPDPLFKRRHRKRRMVQASVVDAARHLLVPGGEWVWRAWGVVLCVV